MLINSHNYNPHLSKDINIPDANSYKVTNKKEFDYFIRNYYEYLNCKKYGYDVIFITLTYNDKSLKRFFNIPVVDYNDIRYLFNRSGLIDYLAKRNTKIKYFLTCEYGEGKGVRGVDNNPHYHMILYIYPIDINNKCLTGKDVYDRIKFYWQGNSNNPQNYNYGRVDVSNQYGLYIESPAAIRYCCKYVTKDLCITKHRTKLLNTAYYYVLQYVLSNKELLQSIIYNQLYDFKSICLKNFEHDINKYYSNVFFNDLQTIRKQYSDLISHQTNNVVDKGNVKKLVDCYVNDIVKQIYKPIIYNRFSPKVRISQKVGLSALDSKDFNEELGQIKVALKNRYSYYNLPLYLYRYKYCNKIKVSSSTDNNKQYFVYKLNDLGITLKTKKLQHDIDIYKAKLKQFINTYFNHKKEDVYKVKLSKEVSIGVYLDNLVKRINYNDFIDYFAKYTLFFRNFNFDIDEVKYIQQSETQFDLINEVSKLLYTQAYEYQYLSAFEYDKIHELKQLSYSYISYKFHPYFAKYTHIYDQFNEVLQKYDTYIDYLQRKEQNEKRAIKRRLNKIFYN